jgi:hypothetical protein
VAVFSYVWDDNFNTRPSDDIPVALLDDDIRATGLGVAERLDAEHEIRDLNADGRHRAGKTTVMESGDDAAMAAISNPQTGALFHNTQGGGSKIYQFNGLSWSLVASADHGDLSGLADHDHPIYVLKTGGTMTGPLNMGGNRLRTNWTGNIAYGFTLYKHKSAAHSLTNHLAILAASILSGKAKISQYDSGTFVLAAGERVFKGPRPAFMFLPQVYVDSAGAAWKFRILPGDSTHGVGLWNGYSAGANCRIRFEYIEDS